MKHCPHCKVDIEFPEKEIDLTVDRVHFEEPKVIGQIKWVSPHEAIYDGRSYKPKERRI